jgi:hypothetical protein
MGTYFFGWAKVAKKVPFFLERILRVKFTEVEKSALPPIRGQAAKDVKPLRC